MSDVRLSFPADPHAPSPGHVVRRPTGSRCLRRCPSPYPLSHAPARMSARNPPRPAAPVPDATSRTRHPSPRACGTKPGPKARSLPGPARSSAITSLSSDLAPLGIAYLRVSRTHGARISRQIEDGVRRTVTIKPCAEQDCSRPLFSPPPRRRGGGPGNEAAGSV